MAEVFNGYITCPDCKNQYHMIIDEFGRVFLDSKEE